MCAITKRTTRRGTVRAPGHVLLRAAVGASSVTSLVSFARAIQTDAIGTLVVLHARLPAAQETLACSIATKIPITNVSGILVVFVIETGSERLTCAGGFAVGTKRALRRATMEVFTAFAYALGVASTRTIHSQTKQTVASPRTAIDS